MIKEVSIQNIPDIQATPTPVAGISNIKIDKQIGIYKAYLPTSYFYSSGDVSIPASSSAYMILFPKAIQVSGAQSRHFTDTGNRSIVFEDMGTYLIQGTLSVDTTTNTSTTVLGVEGYETTKKLTDYKFYGNEIYLYGGAEDKILINVVENFDKGDKIYFKGTNFSTTTAYPANIQLNIIKLS